MVELFDRGIDTRYSLHARGLATKRDVAELQARITAVEASLSARIAGVEASLSARITEVEARLGGRIVDLDARLRTLDANVSARLAETKAELLKWGLTALTAQTALLLSAIKLF